MPVWYITFHGGDAPHDWNTIHIFDLEGKPLGKALDTKTLPKGLELRELRGFSFGPDGDLFVANAYKDASQVLRFEGTPGSDGKHAFREVFVERHPSNPGLAHPFDVTFGPDGNLYVPSQDTNLVGRYYGPGAAEEGAGKPMPQPAALRGMGAKEPPPGTFVPSHAHLPTGVRTVRRAIFGPDGDLYVADRGADSVKRYDGQSGALRREYRHHHLTTPVHLIFREDGTLLVGSRDRDTILAVETVTGTTKALVASGAGGLKGPAGMALGPDGNLYVSSREGRQILRFDAESGMPDPAPFIADLGDAPEFIRLVNV